MNFFTVTTTSDDRAVLDAIAKRLIEDRLAACCQISSPITSIYRWDGQIESSTEFELKIKTVESRLDDVIELIGRLHRYDVPQIVAAKIDRLSDAYQAWIIANIDA